MAGRDAERPRDVLARNLVEHAQRDHRALRLGQLAHAAGQLLLLLQRFQPLFRGRRRVGQGVDHGVVGDVGPRARVQTTPVAGDVARQRGQQLARILGRRNQVGRVGPRHEGAERLLHGVEGVLGQQPLGACDARQVGAVRMDQPRHPVGEAHDGGVLASDLARQAGGATVRALVLVRAHKSLFHGDAPAGGGLPRP